MTRHRLCLLLAFCWATMIGFEGAKLLAKEPGLPSWQLEGVASACFEVKDEATLRTTDGVTINTIAHLVVVHVDRRGNVVTFGERTR